MLIDQEVDCQICGGGWGLEKKKNTDFSVFSQSEYISYFINVIGLM